MTAGTQPPSDRVQGVPREAARSLFQDLKDLIYVGTVGDSHLLLQHEIEAAYERIIVKYPGNEAFFKYFKTRYIDRMSALPVQRLRTAESMNEIIGVLFPELVITYHLVRQHIYIYTLCPDTSMHDGKQ